MYTEDADGEAVPYGEFVALARDEGLITLDVQVVQTPSDGNGRSAVVQAIARTRDGSFGAIGEASPSSAPAAWHPFLTTLAELRAKARALREMTGLDHAVQEELTVPYGVAGGAGGVGEREPQTPPQIRSMTPPTIQRGMSGTSGMRTAPVAAASAPVAAASAPSAASPPPSPRADEDDEESDGDAEEHAPTPRMASAPAAPRALSPAPAAEPDDEPPADYDAIPPDMLDKLKRLAISIADLEGTELSDAQALLKLDDFFMRAFRHPLGRSTRIEGQRVVQKLSSDLAKRRAAAADDDE